MSRNLLIFQKRSDLGGAQRVFTGAKGGGESTGHRGGRGELVNGEQRHTEEMELREGGLRR